MAKFIEVTENNGVVSMVNKDSIRFVSVLTDDVINCLDLTLDDYDESNTIMFVESGTLGQPMYLLLQECYRELAEQLM